MNREQFLAKRSWLRGIPADHPAATTDACARGPEASPIAARHSPAGALVDYYHGLHQDRAKSATPPA